MSQTTVNLVTTGMHCSSCAMLIDITLADLAGVESSRTDQAEGSTIVVFDDQATTVGAIIEAIRGAGYEAMLHA